MKKYTPEEFIAGMKLCCEVLVYGGKHGVKLLEELNKNEMMREIARMGQAADDLLNK